ncbi:MAG: TonB-dependent receptor [Cellvibrionaceae bacterium]|nr:TonB-dependent receptor [Cellvibrionaceae bacterium]
MNKPVIYPRLLAMAIALATTANAQEETEEENLEDKFDEIVIITGVKAADQNARNMEREKDNFSSVIAADDLGNFVDQNIAESLRRLPGVGLQRTEGEGKFVTVRGLGPGFVTVNINGSESATADNDGRGFALDLVSNDMIGSIEVHKTLTPDMNLNSIGGSVNINSVSAFVRNRDSFQLRLQGAYQNNRGEFSPKTALTGTKLLLDDILGIGFTASYEDRQTQVDEVRHHSDGNMILRQQDIPDSIGPSILTPRQLQIRQEIANRQRIGGSLNVELRPSDDHQYYFRVNHSELTDEDIALREFFDFQDAGGGDTVFINEATKEFAVSDIDVFHQYFVQEGTNSVTSFSLGAEHMFGNGFTFDYEYAHSESEFSKPNGRRVQFRERELVTLGQAGSDFIRAEIISPERGAELGGFAITDYADNSVGGDASDLSNFEYDNLFIEDSFRNDTVDSIAANLRKDFSSNRLNYIQAGFVVRTRERDRNRDRASFNPADGAAGCNGDAACLAAIDSNWLDYEREFSDNDNFTFPFITRNEMERLIAVTRVTQDAALQGDVSIDGTKDDYALEEETNAAYIMAEFGIADNMNLIAGVRYETTELTSTGSFSIENDDFQFAGTNTDIDIAIPMQPAANSYNGLFPSVHLNWEASEQLLVRAALWTSFTRPSFAQTVTRATIDNDILLCVPGTRINNEPGTGECDDADQGGDLALYELAQDNGLEVGNPNLTAMTSINLDTSVGWYPSDDLFVQAAFFYKDIQDFIVDVTGDTIRINELPVELPVDQVTQFIIPNNLELTDVDYAINGDSANVYGVELSYVQYFKSGFFVQSNATIMSSEATLDNSIRAGSIQLPDQSDTTANLVLGWENDTFSASIINNYRSEVLELIGSCPAGVDPLDIENCATWADRFQDAILTTDVRLRYNFTKSFLIYFDMLNLTEQEDRRYFAGNAASGGEILYQLEEYGSSFQLGATVDF